AADRYNINRQWEHLQAKYVGTGHADTSKFEWAVNQHRDTLSSHIGHNDMLSYFAVAENESIGRVRFNMLEVSFRRPLHYATSPSTNRHAYACIGRK
ncbi:hypothetical protein DYB28_009855, partial [Aphanomyces astaci]